MFWCCRFHAVGSLPSMASHILVLTDALHRAVAAASSAAFGCKQRYKDQTEISWCLKRPSNLSRTEVTVWVHSLELSICTWWSYVTPYDFSFHDFSSKNHDPNHQIVYQAAWVSFRILDIVTRISSRFMCMCLAIAIASTSLLCFCQRSSLFSVASFATTHKTFPAFIFCLFCYCGFLVLHGPHYLSLLVKHESSCPCTIQYLIHLRPAVFSTLSAVLHI